MYNHNKAQQSKNPVHISWDILYDLIPGIAKRDWERLYMAWGNIHIDLLIKSIIVQSS